MTAVPADDVGARRSASTAPTSPTSGSGSRSRTPPSSRAAREFGVFANAAAVRYIVAPKELSRAEIAKLEELGEGMGRERARLHRVPGRRRGRSPIAKFLVAGGARRRCAARARRRSSAPASRARSSRILGLLRLHLGRELGLIDEGAWRFNWVTDFPHVRVGRGARALGRRAPSVHSAERRSRASARQRPAAPRGRCLRPRLERHASSRAARSGSTSPSCRPRCSTARRSRRRSSARSSASCSTRSQWARRRTAGSHRASTASPWRCSTSRTSATRWRSRRTRAGTDPHVRRADRR